MKIISFTAIVILAFSCLSGCKQDPTSTLPAFNMRLPDSFSVISTADIPDGGPIVLVHFESDCNECQQETESILKNMDSLKQVRFYFVTLEKFDRLRVFNSHYKLAGFPNITAGQDYAHFLPKHFPRLTTPLLAIYDKNKQLRTVYAGRVPIQNLIKTIHDIQ
jgi:hypothetical protein